MADTDTATFPSATKTAPTTSGGGGAPSTDQPPLIDQAKQQAQKVVEQTQQKAGEVLGQAKDRTKSWAEDRKSEVAQGLSDVAHAVLQTGESLRGQGADTYGKYAEITDQAANLVDKASGYLRDTSVDRMIGEVESFGKREPVLFLVGAAALGFMAARFLKSSGRAAGQGAYNPDRSLPVPMDEQNLGVGTNYGTTSPAG
jgi:vacuolar-type H+-ATPase subunit H